MDDRVVELLAGHGCVADPRAAEHIGRQVDPPAYVRRVLASFLEVPFHLTLEQLLSAEALQAPSPPASRTPASQASIPAEAARWIDAADYDAEVEVLVDASRDEPPVGELNDFVRYFNDRYDSLSRMLRRRRELSNAVPIARIPASGKEVAFIGLVDDVAKSGKTGHRFLEVQDGSGQTTVLVPAGRADLIALADSLVTDEVIGIQAKPSKDASLLVADNLLRPDLPFRAESRPGLELPLRAAFVGDVHMGSSTFLRGAFQRLIRWFHGEEGSERERALARSVKYLVLPGDVVDGVGVYPGQEQSLAIPTVLEQYRELARELERLPEHIHVVVMPGNHDATRPTEPQPAFNPEIRGFFDAVEATFVSNPSTFALHGRRVLAYHGFSMIDFATSVPGLSLERPTEIMRQMLQCRHVAPAYGAKTPVAPEARDRLVVNLEPDIFATGHVHVVGLDRYKGVALVNGGTWQAQTSYQKMHNLTPTPAVLPLLDLSSLTPSKVAFPVAP